MEIRALIVYLCMTIVFLSCKKEKKDNSVPASANEEPDFTLQASDVNYPIGTTWVYSIQSQTETVNIPTSASSYQNASGNYTVIASYDSLINNNITGRVFNYYFTQNISTVRELQYIDPTNSILHKVLFGSINNSGIQTGAISIPLPLSSNNGKWNNLYYPLQSTVDTFNTLGFENLALNIGYLKCIKFQSHDAKNTYWYHKRMGNVRSESSQFSLPNPSTAIAQSSTITLIKFN